MLTLCDYKYYISSAVLLLFLN